MRVARPFLGVSLVVGLVACGGARPAEQVLAPGGVDPLTTTHVLNASTYPVTVYLTRAGMRHRLGVVESLAAASFMVPPRLLTGRKEFRLVAAPLGPHTTYVSETFMLRPGQSADWRIQETTSRQAAIVSLVSVQ